MATPFLQAGACKTIVRVLERTPFCACLTHVSRGSGAIVVRDRDALARPRPAHARACKTVACGRFFLSLCQRVAQNASRLAHTTSLDSRPGRGQHTNTHARTHARTRTRAAHAHARTHARARAHTHTHTRTHTHTDLLLAALLGARAHASRAEGTPLHVLPSTRLEPTPVSLITLKWSCPLKWSPSSQGEP